MTQKLINASIGQFSALIRKPKAWQVLGLKSWGLVRFDEIKYIEVDTFDVPTGRERIGVIFYVGSGDLVLDKGLSTLYYCQDIQSVVGEAVIGRSLIIS